MVSISMSDFFHDMMLPQGPWPIVPNDEWETGRLASSNCRKNLLSCGIQTGHRATVLSRDPRAANGYFSSF